MRTRRSKYDRKQEVTTELPSPKCKTENVGSFKYFDFPHNLITKEIIKISIVVGGDLI